MSLFSAVMVIFWWDNMELTISTTQLKLLWSQIFKPLGLEFRKKNYSVSLLEFCVYQQWQLKLPWSQIFKALDLGFRKKNSQCESAYRNFVPANSGRSVRKKGVLISGIPPLSLSPSPLPPCLPHFILPAMKAMRCAASQTSLCRETNWRR